VQYHLLKLEFELLEWYNIHPLNYVQIQGLAVDQIPGASENNLLNRCTEKSDIPLGVILIKLSS